MPKYKLRKGAKIGALAAENDLMLDRAFIDVGYVDPLANCSNPCFLILGRTGSGKTALIDRIRHCVDHVSKLDPDELSMQYLHNSTLLKTIADWGVNLEIFYKYLWRHVCILELIRMRYGDADDVPTRIQQLFPIPAITKGAKTREASQQYLKEYGDDYWIKTDTRIKNITSEMEHRLTEDPRISAKLHSPIATVQGSIGSTEQTVLKQTVEEEVLQRVQRVVSDFQIAALNRVVELLSKYGFEDEQNPYYLLIDDLDKNWMPDDRLYLDLLKSLLTTVQELNHRLRGVKIIVALRENIYYRVFQKSEQHEPQREKWADVAVRIRWEETNLTNLIDQRLIQLYRQEYTTKAPTFRDVLPEQKRKTHENPVDFILQRTFMRPRDLIDFVNTALEQSNCSLPLTWSNLTKAESEYSQRRLTSVFDEWKDSFYGLPAVFPIIRRLGNRFALADFTEDDAFEILKHQSVEKCGWLQQLQSQLLADKITFPHFYLQITKTLYLVGIVGVKQDDSPHVFYSFERPFSFMPGIVGTCEFLVHKMFWSSLNIARSATEAR